MKKKRRRKCRCCGELYHPDHRNLHHQRHCSKPACRKASQRAACTRWRRSEKGKGYFQGPEQLARIQQWREQNPGYWRDRGTKPQNALQHDCTTQPDGSQEVIPSLTADALQHLFSTQPAVVVGLISSLTGSALQHDIAVSIRGFHARGQDILGIRSGDAPRRRSA